MIQVLTPDEIVHYRRRGYVCLQNAFSADTIQRVQQYVWAQLQENYGYDRDNSKSWHTNTAGLSRRCQSNRALWSEASPRLLGAITQLLGSQWQMPAHWGTLLFSLPNVNGLPWSVSRGTWHWDNDPFAILNGGSGLFIFSFISEVMPTGGGTLIVDGSPELVMRYHRNLSPHERAQKRKTLRRRFYTLYPWLADLTHGVGEPEDRNQRLMNEFAEIDGYPVRVVELTGKPGDAVLCHPVILHSRSENRSQVPRLMRAQTVGMNIAG